MLNATPVLSADSPPLVYGPGLLFQTVPNIALPAPLNMATTSYSILLDAELELAGR